MPDCCNCHEAFSYQRQLWPLYLEHYRAYTPSVDRIFFGIMFTIGDDLPAIVWFDMLDVFVVVTVPQIDNAAQVCASRCVPRQARGVLVPAIMAKYLVNS